MTWDITTMQLLRQRQFISRDAADTHILMTAFCLSDCRCVTVFVLCSCSLVSFFGQSPYTYKYTLQWVTAPAGWQPGVVYVCSKPTLLNHRACDKHFTKSQLSLGNHTKYFGSLKHFNALLSASSHLNELPDHKEYILKHIPDFVSKIYIIFYLSFSGSGQVLTEMYRGQCVTTIKARKLLPLSVQTGFVSS